jgi:hypothetical protein
LFEKLKKIEKNATDFLDPSGEEELREETDAILGYELTGILAVARKLAFV